MRGALADALAVFAGEDWTFAASRVSDLHGLHPYPARFIPEIPRRLLEIFADLIDGAILDPFCGCGTTLVEAQRQGRPAFGIDLNPIATLISRVKTTPVPPGVSVRAARVARKALHAGSPVPPIPNVDHWFSVGARDALARITSALAAIRSPTERDALMLALSRIVVRVSRQESDTRYAAVEREMTLEAVAEMFVESARHVENTLREHADVASRAEATVLTADVLGVLGTELPRRIGMVITSPPYPNAYEYWLYHKYRMYWLGHDPLPVRAREIGARPHYFRKQAATPADFRDQMLACFRLFDRVMVPNGLVCFVVGRSIIKAREIDNAALVTSAAAAAGFEHLATAARRIPATRKAFNPKNSPIAKEELLLFRRRR